MGQAITSLYHELYGPKDLPPITLRYIRELETSDRSFARDELARYEVALRFLAEPGGGIPNWAAEAAHIRAVEMIWRRPKLSDLHFEIGEIKRFYDMYRITGSHPVQAVAEAIDAAEAEVESAGSPPRGRRPDAVEERFKAVRERMSRLSSELGWDEVPSFMESYAHALAADHEYVSYLLADLESYAFMLRFGMRPHAMSGPELSPEAAHARAVNVQVSNRSLYVQERIAAIFEEVYRRLMAPIEREGFGMGVEEASAMALQMADTQVPLAGYALEILTRRQILPGFFAKPIREGGLGLPPEQAAAARVVFDEKFPPYQRSKDLIAIYERAVARHLAHAAATGQYDELKARDQALARIAKSESLFIVMVAMDREGYPRVTLSELPPLSKAAPESTSRKGLRGFLKGCISDLLGKTGVGAK